MAETLGNRRAEKNNLFVCCACGKVSTWKYGFTDKNENTEEVDGQLQRVASSGWDASCTMHAQEFPRAWLHYTESGRVTEIKKPEAP